MVRERHGGMRSVSGHLDSPTLPELRPEIVPDNLRAAAALYYAAKLDELGLFDVADLVARGFADGALALPPSDLPLTYWRARDDRPSPAARAVVCARVIGCGPAADELGGNCDAPLLLDRWLTLAAATPPDPGMAATYAVAPPVDTRARATLLQPDILPSFSAEQMAALGGKLHGEGADPSRRTDHEHAAAGSDVRGIQGLHCCSA